jgi:hypothetical protein
MPIWNQRGKIPAASGVRTACPMNMPAKDAAMATAPGSAVAAVSRPAR